VCLLALAHWTSGPENDSHRQLPRDASDASFLLAVDIAVLRRVGELAQKLRMKRRRCAVPFSNMPMLFESLDKMTYLSEAEGTIRRICGWRMQDCSFTSLRYGNVVIMKYHGKCALITVWDVLQHHSLI